MIANSLYEYVWQTTRKYQIWICILSLLIAPLSMVPLELQRRIVEQALGRGFLTQLYILAAAYLAVLLVQGGSKYALNIVKGLVWETVSRDLRLRVIDLDIDPNKRYTAARPIDQGTIVSIIAAEAEDIAEFSSDSLALPLLQSGTIAWVAGYLLWIEPQVAILAIVVYAAQPFLVFRFQKQINKLSRKRLLLVRRLGKHATDNPGPSISENGAAREKSHSLIDRIFRTRIRMYRRKYFLTFLGNFLDALGPLIILTAGGYFVISGETEVSTLVVFISGFQRIADPWDTLINFYRTVSNTRVSFRFVSEVINYRGNPAGTIVSMAKTEPGIGTRI